MYEDILTISDEQKEEVHEFMKELGEQYWAHIYFINWCEKNSGIMLVLNELINVLEAGREENGRAHRES